jgi:spermidine synthase
VRLFALPANDERLQVIEADAGAWLRSRCGEGAFGVVQVDLYDRDAAGPVLDSLAFYRRCREALEDAGIVVVNLFGRHHSFDISWQRLERVFEGRLLMLEPVPEERRS